MNFKRKILSLSIINMVNTSMGFIFHILLGRQFGVSKELDCLFVALAIFGLAGIFNSFFTSLFIPIFNEIKCRDEKDSFVFADVTLKWTALSAIAITIVVWLSGDLIIKFVASGFKEENVALSLDITRIVFIAFVFFSISNAACCILNSLYHFAIPAITGLLHPALNIAVLFVLTPVYGVKGIAISYLASNFLQAGMLLVFISLKTPWKPTWKLYHHKMPFLVKQSSKMTASGLIWSLRDIISRNIASHLPPGAITLLAYAEKIITILAQAAVTPSAKVFYSRISEWIVDNKWSDIKGLFERVVRVNMALVFFIASGVIVFLTPLLNIFFS